MYYNKKKEVDERRIVPSSVNFAGVVDNTENEESIYTVHDDSIIDYSSTYTSDTMFSEKKSGPEDPKTPGPSDNVPSTPPSPRRASRADFSKMGRSINRPVEEKPLLDEIREVLAQSYMMFLMADLRHMSATGRVYTKYENVAVDSDICKRDTANSIACLSDDAEQITLGRGLSPAVIMAILILEIREEALRTLKEKKDDMDIDNDEQFVGYENNSKKKKLTEESMASLMKAYSRLISEDLVSEIPSVQRRRATFHQNSFSFPSPGFLSPSGASFRRYRQSGANKPASSGPPTSSFVGGHNLESVEEVGETSSKDEMLELDPNSGASGSAPNVDEKDEGDTASAPDLLGSINTSARDEPRQSLFSPGKWNRGRTSSADQPQLVHQTSIREQFRMTRENSKQIVDRIKTDLNQQVDNLLSTEANTKKEFQELTNVFFESGEVNEEIKAELGPTYSRIEMVEVIRSAVEARNDDRLQFLSKFFKPGSVSKLMAESRARIVWVNDWYPEKDLIYAISVDDLQKRVMVVFRGAITTTDWKTTLQGRFQKIPNPIEDDYEDKNDVLRVYSGFYNYLFRKRKDTGTTKYDEIANLVHKYGMDRIGPDYNLFVTGHSLGGALTHLFCFFASMDERFTKNGPVRAIAFASPYMGGHSWGDAVRHQERTKKLQLVQCRNNNDAIPRIPLNFVIGRRGPLWRHVGIGVTLPSAPRFGFKWKPMVHYWGKENSCFDSTMHGYRRNIIFHLTWLRPWLFDRSHKLEELQDRLIYGELNSKPGGCFYLLKSTLDELYEKLEENDFQTFSKTKRWGLGRRKGDEHQLNGGEESN